MTNDPRCVFRCVVTPCGKVTALRSRTGVVQFFTAQGELVAADGTRIDASVTCLPDADGIPVLPDHAGLFVRRVADGRALPLGKRCSLVGELLPYVMGALYPEAA